jgi:hypothetical protein
MFTVRSRLHGYRYFINVTWSVTLREEQRLRGLDNGLLREIFGPKRAEVTGQWRGLHNEELHDL